MGKCILNMKTPLIATYNKYGSISAIREEDEGCLNWFYNNFIQIRYVKEWEYLIYDCHNKLFEICPYIRYSVMSRADMKKRGEDFKEVIKTALENNTYIYTHINRKILPMYFETYEYYHEVFIYGYDEDKVYFADNLPATKQMNINGLFAGGKYRGISCEFERFEEAYWSMNDEETYFNEIHFLEKQEAKSYALDLNKIINGLEAYIYSLPTVTCKEHTIFGMEAIKQNINLSRAGKLPEFNVFDIRGFDLMWEHKKLMKKRLIYLKEQGYLINGEKYIIAYESLEDSYKRMKDNYMKYLISGRIQIFDKLMNKLEIELEQETEVIKELIMHLKEKEGVY